MWLAHDLRRGPHVSILERPGHFLSLGSCLFIRGKSRRRERPIVIAGTSFPDKTLTEEYQTFLAEAAKRNPGKTFTRTATLKEVTFWSCVILLTSMIDMFTFEAEKEQSGLKRVHFPGHCRIEPTRMYHATISHGEWPSLALPIAMSPLALSSG
ncbi:hypothetical protein B0T24DRAFT_66125 [Lasiosphaeria ovina]|uniref:Uncharacterized protein n=1 Tax=Lasiosphaeria ovina TaxID=92902 RepID=A0AAE0NLU4_9PEZI|nr:hypothetical protein B0T24DRAFT_66125 [Lasiosphaeria ovina]